MILSRPDTFFNVILAFFSPYSKGRQNISAKGKWGTFYLLIANFFATQNIGGVN
jgi:hypothetical protein